MALTVQDSHATIGASDFTIPSDHTNADAHRWIKKALLTVLPTAFEGNPFHPKIDGLLEDLNLLKPPDQIGILRASVELLPWLRANSGDYRDENYKKGEVLYELVCLLYKRRLTFQETDIYDLLKSSRHGCGHGGDVTAPVNILVTFARRHGMTDELFEALGVFVEGLRKVSSVKAWHAKRKAAVVRLVDLNAPPGRGAKACWSDGVREKLSHLPRQYRNSWTRLILQITVNDQVKAPRNWTGVAERFIKEFGAADVVSRLGEWFPARRETVAVQGAASQLLKHLVWLLETVPDDDRTKHDCDELVRRLAFAEWKPRERAVKVQIAAASYLARRSPNVALEALRHLAAKVHDNDKGESRVKEIVQCFLREHGLR